MKRFDKKSKQYNKKPRHFCQGSTVYESRLWCKYKKSPVETGDVAYFMKNFLRLLALICMRMVQNNKATANMQVALLLFLQRLLAYASAGSTSTPSSAIRLSRVCSDNSVAFILFALSCSGSNTFQLVAPINRQSIHNAPTGLPVYNWETGGGDGCETVSCSMICTTNDERTCS